MTVTSNPLSFRGRRCSAFLRNFYYSENEMFMKIWNFIYNNKYTLCLILSVFLYTSDAFAVFESLDSAGKKIFAGLKSLVAPAATIGIACCCIAGIALRISTNFCCSVRVARSGFVSFGVSAVFPAAVLVELAAAMLITSSH